MVDIEGGFGGPIGSGWPGNEDGYRQNGRIYVKDQGQGHCFKRGNFNIFSNVPIKER